MLPWGPIIEGIATLGGALIGKKSNDDAGEKNAALQREFAQNSLRWKVQDAKAAGLSPYAAIGASGYQAAPSYVGDTSLSGGLQSLGQDISRAFHATRTGPERTLAALQLQRAGLENEHARLENELVKSQIARIKANDNPPFPNPYDQGIEGNTSTSITLERTPIGLRPVPTIDSAMRNQSLFYGAEQWLQTRLGGMGALDKKMTLKYPLPDAARRKGYDHWEWNPFYGQYVPAKSSAPVTFTGTTPEGLR